MRWCQEAEEMWESLSLGGHGEQKVASAEAGAVERAGVKDGGGGGKEAE